MSTDGPRPDERDPDGGDPFDGVEPAASIEAPEADAIEQAEVVGDAPARRPSGLDHEVPEADALEQAMEVPYSDDDDVR
jgi:hypothetical protein